MRGCTALEIAKLVITVVKIDSLRWHDLQWSKYHPRINCKYQPPIKYLNRQTDWNFDKYRGLYTRCRHNDLPSFRPPQVCHRHCYNCSCSAIFALKLLKRRGKETTTRPRPSGGGKEGEKERELKRSLTDRSIDRK